LLDRVDPCHDDRSSQQIYPDLDNKNTPCHETVVHLFRKIEVANRPCGVGPVLNDSVRMNPPKRIHPLRAALSTLPRRSIYRTAPGVPSTLKTSDYQRQELSSPRKQ
jgi:hypothetical protein